MQESGAAARCSYICRYDNVGNNDVTGRFIWLLGSLIVRRPVAFDSRSFDPAKEAQLAATSSSL